MAADSKKTKDEPMNSRVQAWPSPRSYRIDSSFLIFHGGLGPGDSRHHHFGKPVWLKEELERIARQLQKSFRAGEKAQNLSLQAVEELERSEIFNAGKGAKLQSDAKARLTASAMNGRNQAFAAAINVEGLIHPSKLASELLHERDRCLSGLGALAFAASRGYPIERAETEYRLAQWREKIEQKTGTVGCVCLDDQGDTFACTSTGGRGMERPGRVSDSGTPAGNFATPFGAVSCTGVGEDILDVSLASSITTRLEDGMSLQEAVYRSFVRHPNRRMGMIGIDSHGFGICHANHGTLSFGIVTKKIIYVGITSEDWENLSSRFGS